MLFFLLLIGCSNPDHNPNSFNVINQMDYRDTVVAINLGELLKDSIPDSLFEYKNLESLNLCCNELTKLDSRIANLSSLKKLDLYHTKINNFPDVFYSLSNIEELDLTSMYKLDYQAVLPKLHRFPKFFGTSAKFWMGLQDDYDLEEEKNQMGKELNDINPIAGNAA